MEELLKELNIEKSEIFTVDSSKITENVMGKLDDAPKGNVVSLEKTAKLIPMVAVVAVILLMAVTSLAFESGREFWTKVFTVIEAPTDNYELVAVEDKRYEKTAKEEEPPTEEVTDVAEEDNGTIFDKYHKEEPEKAEEYLQDIYDSVEDENYMLIVNEVMGDNKNVYLALTIKAKNEEAIEQLNNETYGWFRIEAYDENMGWSGVSNAGDEILDKRRENARSYTVHVFGDDHLSNGYEQMRITCRAFSPEMEDERYVYFEIKRKAGIVEFELSGQDFEGGYIYLTAMSVELTAPKEPTAEYAPEARNLNTFFKFKNGTIKTMNQVAGFDGGFNYIGTSDNLYKFSAGTKNVLDVDNLESVIVKGIEYPVDDPENYAPCDVPESLKPFVISTQGIRKDNVYYMCSIQQLGPCVDITYEEYGVVEFVYGGKRYRAEADNPIVIINGKNEYALNVAPYADENGDLWVSGEFLMLLLGIRCDEIATTGTYFMVP